MTYLNRTDQSWRVFIIGVSRSSCAVPIAGQSVTVLGNNIQTPKYLMKIRPVVMALFLAHTGMDRRTEVARLKVTFRRIFFQRGYKPCKEVTTSVS
jgi:hypothetical protein